MTNLSIARLSYSFSVFLLFLASGLFTSSLQASPSRPAMNARVSSMKTFDGQIMACQFPENLGQVAYRLKSATGVVLGGEVEITVKLETLKCVQTASGLTFVSSELASPVANPFGGYIAFKTLEFVAYTTDLKLVQAAKLDLNEYDHTAVFRAPVTAFSGFYKRNVMANGEFRAVMIGFLRGVSETGAVDRLTGLPSARQTGNTSFGSFTMTLSSANNTLSFSKELTPKIASAK